MFYLSFISYKRFRNLVCLFLGISFTVVIHLSQCSLTDKFHIVRPFSQRQFFYAVFCEDYEKGQNVEHDFLMNKGTPLSSEAKDNLYSVIVEMNPEFTPGEDIYSINFENIDCERLREKVDKYASSITDGLMYFYSNWDSTYNLYCMTSPYFSKERETEPATIAHKILQQLKYSVENGYYKYNFLFGYRTECSDDEKKYINELISWVEMSENDAEDMLSRCNAACQMIDEQMGGNTSFSIDRMMFYVPGDINDADIKYYKIETEEGITSAFARMISDYMGICAGILPVILAAFVFDNENHNELILSCGIDSKKYIKAKYIGVVLPYSVLFLIIYTADSFLFLSFGQCTSSLECYGTFMLYMLVWVVPTLCFATAMSMFLAKLINNNIAAAFITLIVVFLSLSIKTGSIYMVQPIIRYNTFGETATFCRLLPRIIINRVITIVLTALMLFGTRCLNEYRRTHYR